MITNSIDDTIMSINKLTNIENNKARGSKKSKPLPINSFMMKQVRILRYLSIKVTRSL